jgi:diguanylate cyclase (GGDEF)-like protein/PAS domain S-box-containing protein
MDNRLMSLSTPNSLRENPFKGELTDEQFRQILAQQVCYSVLDENAIIAITDTKGVIKYANHAFSKLSQYSLAELIGENHRILNSGFHPPSFFKDMFREISKGKRWRREIKNRAKDGSFYWVDTTIVPIRDEREKLLGYAAIRIDITPRKVAEEACRASEERFRDLTSSGSDWFWELDSSYRFTEVSAGVALLGLDTTFFLGKRPWELPIESENVSMIGHRTTLEERRSFKNNIFKVWSGEVPSLQWLSLSGRPRFDSNKRFIGFRGVGRCVTGRFLAEKGMREQSNMLQAIKQSFPGGFAVINDEMQIIESNAQFKTLLSLPDSFFEGSHGTLEEIFRFCAVRGDFGPGDVDELVATNRERTRVETRRIYEHKAADGTVLEIRSAPLRGGGWVRTYVDITERRRTEADIKHLADHDALTGLPNRRALRQSIGEAFARASRKDDAFSLLLLDLDHFKNVNDTFGHPTGDALLMQVAERLRQCARTGDTVARIGGDEFAIVLNGVRSARVGADIAERVIKVVSEPYILDNRKVLIGVTVGAAIAPCDGKSADQLFKKADIALYQAKANGRGICRFFDAELQIQSTKRVTLERDLREALDGNQFEVYFQPQIALSNDAVVGFEALIRWNHPTRGIVSPQTFISIAEENGLINPIGEWVLRSACETAAAWPAHIKVAVNVSPAQLKDASFLKRVDKALEQSGLPACRLEIEITENAILQLDTKTLALLQALRKRGITLAMDDFGTGYSSLNSLLGFQFDKIKIDRSFLIRLPGCDRSLTFLRAIVLLGKGLGIATIAEGIESRQQLELVREEGCSEVQGYLLGRPRPISDHADLFDKQPINLSRAGLRAIARIA